MSIARIDVSVTPEFWGRVNYDFGADVRPDFHGWKPMLTAKSRLSDFVPVPEGTSRCQCRVSNPLPPQKRAVNSGMYPQIYLAFPEDTSQSFCVVIP